MDEINTLLQLNINKPSGILTGEVPVWNGTTFVRSTVTPIGIDGLSGYPGDATKVLKGDGSWGSVAQAVGVTTPADPLGTLSATPLMLGLDGTITTSANSTGNIFILVTGVEKGYTNSSLTMQLKLGTTTAPSNGAASTGTSEGVAITDNGGRSSFIPFALSAVATGLASSTAYWIDIVASSSGQNISDAVRMGPASMVITAFEVG